MVDQKKSFFGQPLFKYNNNNLIFIMRLGNAMQT